MQLDHDFKDTEDNSIKTELLISLVRDRPHLWNTALSDYRDVAKMSKSWEEIGNLLDISASMAKIEWRKLRDKFVRIKRLTKSSGEKYSPSNKWVYEEQLTFLTSVIRHRGTTTSAYNCPDFSGYPINYREYENSDQGIFEDSPTITNKCDTPNGFNRGRPDSFDLEYSINSGPPLRKRHVIEDDADSFRSVNQFKSAMMRNITLDYT